MCCQRFEPVASKHFIGMQGEDKAHMTLIGAVVLCWRTDKYNVFEKEQTNKFHTLPITHLLLLERVLPSD